MHLYYVAPEHVALHPVVRRHPGVKFCSALDITFEQQYLQTITGHDRTSVKHDSNLLSV